MAKNKDDIRDTLNIIRNLQEGAIIAKPILTEAKDDDKKDEKKPKRAIAITDDPRFGNRALSNQIEQFRSSVESGAEFSTPEEGKVADSPLIYMKDTKNLVFSGIIPCLNNLKWQFVLKTSTGNGCFIWADELILNKDNIQILNKLYGFYLNWKDQWNSEAADLDRMVRGMEDE